MLPHPRHDRPGHDHPLRRFFSWLAIVLACGLLPGAHLESVPFEDDVDAPTIVQTAPADRVGNARVTVRTDEGAPLVGAVVRAWVVRDATLLLAGRATTGADGIAKIEGLPLGAHWLIADAPGRARATTQRFVAGDVDAELRLGKERPLRVEVHDDSGRAVAAASLEIHGADPLPRGARTDRDGVANPSGLGEGVLKVIARAPGFDEASTSTAQTDASGVVRLTLHRLGVLVVRTVDTKGLPLVGASIAIAGGRLGTPRSTVSDGAGTAKIAGLAAGSYDLRATKDSLVSPIEIGVPVARGAETTVKLTLLPGLSLQVHVVDETNAAVASASIVASEGGLSPFPLEATTDADGMATITPIDASAISTSVSAHATGFVGRAGVVVAAAKGATSVATTITLRRAATLLGDVLDGNGAPIDGATIEVVGTDLDGLPIDVTPSSLDFGAALFLRGANGPGTLLPSGELGVVPGPVPPIPRGPPRNTSISRGNGAEIEPWVSDASGTFRARPVPPGKLRAIARHPAYVEGLSEVVEVAPGGEATVHVVLAAGGHLVGRVRDEHGSPVAGAFITASARLGALSRGTRTSTDGTFVLASVPRDLSLTVAPADHPTEVAVRLDVIVPEGGIRDLDITMPSPRPPLRAHVVDDRRYPIRGAQVTVASLDPSAPTKTTAFTDDHGDAELPRSAGLHAQLDVDSPGYAPHHASFSSSPDHVEIELVVGLLVRATIYAPSGRTPQAGAVVSLRIVGGTQGETTTELHAVSDGDGQASFRDAPRGDGVIIARAAGTSGARKAVTIAPIGSLPEVDLGRIELGRAGIVEGEVVDESGRVVAGARIGRDHVAMLVPASGQGALAVTATDAEGTFRLVDVATGEAEIEAFSSDVGVGRSERIRIDEGRTTSRVRIVLHPIADASRDRIGSGVAVTLDNESGSPLITVVAMSSEAERAGLFEGDEIVSVDGVSVGTDAQARARLPGPAGSDAIVVIRRAGAERTVRVPREPLRM